MKKPFALIILDGLGITKSTKYNAWTHASTPNLSTWLQHYPHADLKASGQAVGLLPGMIGNSEVGHMVIGAGRSIPQVITRSLTDIESGVFFKNNMLTETIQNAAQRHKEVHILGLLSDAGVHNHIAQTTALLKLITEYTKSISIHAFLDGRDVPPRSAAHYLTQLDTYWENLTGEQQAPIRTLQGRFYAMDRDNNWERTTASYDAMTLQLSANIPYFATWQEALDTYYRKHITDEFIPPTRIGNFKPITENSLLIVTNIRADRSRQLVELFEETIDIPIITFIAYKPSFHATVLYDNPQATNTLLDQLEYYKKSIFSIAETEKYAHITYFFNGGRETIRHNETRILIPSHSQHQTYANNPAMSAPEITDAIIHSLSSNPADFYLINYANPDMVGHSGNFAATSKAIEIIDAQLGRLYKEIVEKHSGTLLIISDHGNAECMYNEQLNQPNTAHTLHPVPCILVHNTADRLTERQAKLNNMVYKLESLADIAPFILRYLHVPVPAQMK